ncbi:hypothetical protein L0152_29920, partial [bacterium]|nr:hypothetical protein [bacterium]
SNLSQFPESLTFRIASCTVTIPDGSKIESSKVEWLGISEQTANDLCAEPSSSEQRAMRDEIKDFLIQELNARGGTISALQIQKTGQGLGYSATSLHRAKRKIGIKSVMQRGTDGENSRWIWKLPKHLGEDAKS